MKDLQCLRREIIFHGKVDSEGFWTTSLKKGKECGIRYKMYLIKDQWAKKTAKNHDPLALISHSHASSSHSHANSSYSPPSCYVTHSPSVVDYDDEYQGEL
ncbi:hypothetical protein Tco_0412459 [Tanacetum coccineum]